ncbi:alpha/beta fold hydrolase [Pseudomonas putida]|uniref:Alpha/beta fold hydrolase n=1 Tax=Pseudomonas putida TaxID=303 RepID=A0A2Z4RFD5_PSEPU|nr:triacylglycerol lipase [Pseudomonas putida]AWY39455.1 alpha/beta fold hydrolase [Pseudomonas putida]
MQRIAATHYPILLVHGLFGFDRIGNFELFHDIKQALRNSGARVFVPHLSATHSNEARGEQLLAQINRVLQGTGASKVNLIGHSQGALAARYAGALAPGSVASITSVSGPNHGSELADVLRKALIPGQLPEYVAEAVATLFAEFLALLGGHHQLPQYALAALNAVTTEGVGAFNDKYPQGLPKTRGGQGCELVNGIRYYSWSGTVQGSLLEGGHKSISPLHNCLRTLSRYFVNETEQNDGLVGRFSSHLGTVIRSDYPLDHLDTLRQTSLVTANAIDPIDLYVQHAERLKKAGL